MTSGEWQWKRIEEASKAQRYKKRGAGEHKSSRLIWLGLTALR